MKKIYKVGDIVRFNHKLSKSHLKGRVNKINVMNGVVQSYKIGLVWFRPEDIYQDEEDIEKHDKRKLF